jgi:hypothetical protein
LEAIALGGIGQRWFHFENESINEVSNGLLEGLNIGLEGLIFLLKIWIQFKITKFVVLFFLSPIFALYAELIAKKSGVQRHAGRGMMWSMWRGIRSAGLFVFLELVISTILFLMLGVLPMAVPAMALLAWGMLPVFSAAISVWFYGAALLDLSWDLKGLGVWNALLGSIQHSGVVIAVGLPFYLAMGVPFLGWLTGPVFGGLLGSVAAVLCMHKPSTVEGPFRI